MEIDAVDVAAARLELLRRLDLVGRQVPSLDGALGDPGAANEDAGVRWGGNAGLAWFGDAVLRLAVGHHVRNRFPDQPVGWLHDEAGRCVTNEHLAQVGCGLGLPHALVLGHQPRYADETKVVARGLEAAIGAVFIDEGWPAVLRIVDRLIVEHDG